ncbi:MAG: hypothetical protein HQ568_00480 [Calditrichaeota bacterium]|nr:hypothetical protein [Calditrichota bacterium]
MPLLLHRTSRFLLFILLLSYLVSTPAIAKDWKLIKPVEGKKISLLIKDKQRSYWKISSEDTLIIKTVGPGELKISTRMVLSSKKKEGVYSFKTYLDGKRQPLTARATEYTKSAVNAKFSKQRLGQSRSIIYQVAEGEHEYKFMLPKDSKKKVYVRPFILTDEKDKTNYIAYLPRSFPEEVRIIVNEREYIYYRSSSDKPIELEVIGPTEVKCVSRLEFDVTMHGNQNYRLQIAEKDSIILTSFFKGEISSTASYIGNSNMVIGKGAVVFFSVPEGKHKYHISTPDQNTSVLFRFYLPEKDLGNVIQQDTSYSQR